MDERSLWGSSTGGTDTWETDSSTTSTGSGSGGGSSSSSGGGPPPIHPADDCQIEGKADPEPDNPPEKTDGGLWDQNGWSACAYIALINANILSGADDEDGEFQQKVRDCLEERGIDGNDIADGLTDNEKEEIAEVQGGGDGGGRQLGQHR